MGPLRYGLAVTVLVTLASACSGDSDEGDALPNTVVTNPPREGPAFEEWQAATSAVCEEFEPQQDAVTAAHPPSSDPEDMVALIDALTPVATAYEAALNEIVLPVTRFREVERARELTRLNFEAAESLRAAALDNDAAGVQAAASALDAQSRDLQQVFTNLGVPACA